MAALTLTLTPVAPNHGDTVTATYAVVGNDGTPPQSAQVDGAAKVGDDDLQVSVVITLPGVDAKTEEFWKPTCDGLTFVATSDPKVWTAVVA